MHVLKINSKVLMWVKDQLPVAMASGLCLGYHLPIALEIQIVVLACYLTTSTLTYAYLLILLDFYFW